MIRLLSKQDIQQAKARERQQEITEGVKLAQRVDSLRELQAEEEQALKKFRDETLTEIHKEITEKITERDSLIYELSRLKKDREEAIKPLTKEWEKIDQVNRGLNEQGNLLTERELAVQKKEELAEEEIYHAKEANFRAKSREDNALRLNQDTEQKNLIASENFSQSIFIKEQSEKLAQEVEIDLRKRDTELAIQERDNSVTRKLLETERENLNKEWKLLNDRKALFERNLKRIKNGN